MPAPTKPESPDDIIQVMRLGTQATTRRGDMMEGDVPLSTATVAGQQAQTEQREALSGIDEKVSTFVEGAVDALSLGLIRERSNMADVRREVNSGSALAGEIFGNALSLKVPGISGIAEAGENIGKAVADAAGAGQILGRGLTDAGIGAALGGAGAAGHNLFDSLIDDKPFSMEAVAKETGLSGMLGFGLGVLGGGLAAAKGGRIPVSEMRAQGGFMDPSSPESMSAVQHVGQAVDGMDQGVAVHEARLKGLQAIEDKDWFNLNSDLMKSRSDALKAVKEARAKLPDNLVAAMKSGDPALSRSIDDYEDAFNALDAVMRPNALERFQVQRLGRALTPDEIQAKLAEGDQKFWNGGSFEDHYFGPDDVPLANIGVNANMAADMPDAMVESGGPLGKQFRPGIKDPAARYEEIYGRPWQPVSEGAPLPAEFGALPGGEETPTSNLKTNAGKAKAQTGAQADAAEALDAFRDRSFEAVPESERGFMPEWMPGGGKTMASGMPEGMQFPGEVTPEAAAMGEAGGRTLEPRNTGDALNGAYLQDRLQVLPDGYMQPASTAQANAEAFARFQDKMADDTLARKARKAESLKRFQAERAGDIASLEPAEPAQPSPNALSRGKGPEFRDTAIESKADIRSRNNQNAIDASLEASIKGKSMSQALAEQEANVLPPEFQAAQAAPDEGLSRLNDFLGLKAEVPPTPDVAAHQFIDQWFTESQRLGPRVTPGDLAASRIQQAADALYGATEGRADSISALDLAKEHGFHEARNALATRIQQVQLLPKAAEAAQKLATLAGQAAKEGGESSAPAKGGKFSNWAKRKVGGYLGAKAGAAMGGPIGGIMGYQLGAEALGNYAKAATQVAGAAGRAAQRCAAVGEALLRGGRGGAIAAGVVNRPYAYSPEGPVKDPVERILEIQRVAANPDAVREMARKQMGDLAVIHPQMAQLLEDHVVNQVTSISMSAPHIYFDRMGNPMAPPSGEMRAFLEYENAVHNVDQTLNKMAKGAATPSEVRAMHETAPQHMQKVAESIMRATDLLNRLNGEARRRLESMTGIPVTGRSDPNFVAQQAATWQKINSNAQQGKNNPQALKPGAQGMTTPGQGGLAGRAPGN